MNTDTRSPLEREFDNDTLREVATPDMQVAKLNTLVRILKNERDCMLFNWKVSEKAYNKVCAEYKQTLKELDEMLNGLWMD